MCIWMSVKMMACTAWKLWKISTPLLSLLTLNTSYFPSPWFLYPSHFCSLRFALTSIFSFFLSLYATWSPPRWWLSPFPTCWCPQALSQIQDFLLRSRLTFQSFKCPVKKLIQSSLCFSDIMVNIRNRKCIPMKLGISTLLTSKVYLVSLSFHWLIISNHQVAETKS